jgi:hypothetical protein
MVFRTAEYRTRCTVRLRMNQEDWSRSLASRTVTWGRRHPGSTPAPTASARNRRSRPGRSSPATAGLPPATGSAPGSCPVRVASNISE